MEFHIHVQQTCFDLRIERERERFELKSEEAYRFFAVLSVFLIFSCCLDMLLRDGAMGNVGLELGQGEKIWDRGVEVKWKEEK